MAETSIKISLELADKAANKALSDFIAKGDSAEKSLNKLNTTGKGTFNEIAVSIGKATGVFDIFAGNLAANIATKGIETLASAASSLFQTFIVDGVHAAAEGEAALNSLNIALAQSGQYSKKTSEDFVKFAEELQATTAFEDDVIIKNAALIQSMAQLDQDGLKRATKAALDLSVAFDKDIGTASEALAKAANGNVTALQKMGFEIQKGRTDAETFANALKAVEDRVGNAASGQVRTYSGAISQASVAFGNLTEEVGNLIVKNPAVIAVINEIAKLFREWTGAMSANSTAIAELVARGLSSLLTVGSFVVTMGDALVRVFQTLYGVVQALAAPLLAITVPLNALKVGFAEASKQASEYAQSTLKNLTALGKGGDGALAGLSESMLRLREAADRGLAVMQNGATTTVEPINRAGKAVRDLGEDAKRSQDQLKSFTLELVKQGESAKSSADAQIQAIQAKNDVELAKQQELLDKKLITEADYLTRKAEVEAQFDAAKVEIENQKFAEDQAKLDQALAQKVVSEQQYLAAKQQLNANHDLQLAKLDADRVKREVDNKKKLIDAEERLNAQKVRAVGDTFQNLSSLMRTSSKELFEIGKAASIASATINTYEAITKTMASVPYPFNIPLAIAQGIAGFVQVSNIARTGPSFEDGGIVPGTSFTGDRVQANVNSGEMILNRAQQATLFKVANGGQASGGIAGSLEAKLDQLINLLAGKDETIIVNVGGRTIAEVLRSETAAGRTFA